MSKTLVYVSQWTVKGKPTENQMNTPGGAFGGISIYELKEDCRGMTYIGHFDGPARSSCLTWIPETDTMYVANQTKGRGRNGWRNGSTLWSLKLDRQTGMLEETDRVPTMGANPEAISVIPGRNAICMACTGGNDHVEKIVQTNDGTWTTIYVYDDGAISMWVLNDDGTIGRVLDVAVHRDHGPDPSASPQHNGGAQVAGHPHSCTIDQKGEFLVSGDKGSDKIYVYRIREDHLELVSSRWLGTTTGGRHVAFDPIDTDRLYLTTEFSSELFSFELDRESGGLHLLDRISTIDPSFTLRNEPATIRVHPNGKYVYINNRGEDTLVTVEVDEKGRMKRKSVFQLSRSEGDPVNATRQFEISPDGKYIFVAERPADMIRIIEMKEDGVLEDVDSIPVINPSSVCFVEL